MNTKFCSAGLIALLAILLPVLTSCANESNTVPDQRLTGQWHGKHRFSGINYEEATQKKVVPQDVEIVLHFSTDGKVTGQLGGAALSDCVVESNRGWLGRKLNIKTDFVIHGRIIGAIVTGSEAGTNTISAPFNLLDGQIKGTVFVTHPFKYPYPILGLRLSREP